MFVGSKGYCCQVSDGEEAGNIERQKKEENLRQLAQKARNTRIGIKETAPNEGTVRNKKHR